MKTPWKTLWRKLPKLSRRSRVIRNLLLSGLLLAALPWLLDWPALTAEAAFHQLERSALLSPSELVLRVGNAFLAEGEDWVTVGVAEEYGDNWKPFQNKMPYLVNVVPKDGLVVVALPEVENDTMTVAVTGLPDRAEGGILSLTISGVENQLDFLHMEETETFTAQASRQGEWMFFRLEAHEHGADSVCILEQLWRTFLFGRGVDQYPYTLELWDAQGEIVDTAASVLPPDQRFLDGRLLR